MEKRVQAIAPVHMQAGMTSILSSEPGPWRSFCHSQTVASAAAQPMASYVSVREHCSTFPHGLGTSN